MSFYRTFLAAVAAIALASPVFADDTTSAPVDNNTPATTQTDSSMSSSDAGTTVNMNVTKVNVNTATPKQLMKLKLVNAARARALVACRNKQKPDKTFKSLDDVKKCKVFMKMKERDLNKILDQLTVE